MAENVQRVCCLYRLGDNAGSLEIIYLDNVSSVTLGRAESNDYQLNESAVISRRHALLEKTNDGSWAVTDLASSNGIYVNYSKIPASIPFTLGDRDIIELGKDPQSKNPAVYCFQFYKQAKVKCRKSTNDDPQAKRRCIRDSFDAGSSFYSQDSSPSKSLLRQKLAEKELLLRTEMEQKQKEAELKIKAMEEELARREDEQRQKMEEIEKQKKQLASELEEQKEQQERLNAEQQELSLKLKQTEEAKQSMELQLQQERLNIETQLKEQEEIQRQLEEKETDYNKQMEAARVDAEKQIQKLTELLEAKELQQEEMEHEKEAIEKQLQAQQEKLATDKEQFEMEMNQQMRAREEKIKTELEQEMAKLQEEKQKVEENLQTQLTKTIQEKDQELEAELRKQQRNLTDQLNQMEQKHMSLQAQLQATLSEVELAKKSGLQAKHEMTLQLEDLMESELVCAICSELFIQATSLNCSHSFCSLCIEKWMARKKECPNCRTKISSFVHSLVLDNYIDKMFQQYLGEALKQKRDETVKLRKAEQKEYDKSKKKAKPGAAAAVPQAPAVVSNRHAGPNRAEQLAFDITQYLAGQQTLPRAIQGQRIPRIQNNQNPATSTGAPQAAAVVAAAIGRATQRINPRTSGQAPAQVYQVDPRAAAQPVGQRAITSGVSVNNATFIQTPQGGARSTAPAAVSQNNTVTTTPQTGVRIAPYIPPNMMTTVTQPNTATSVPMTVTTYSNGIPYQTIYNGTNVVMVPVRQNHAVASTSAVNQRQHQATNQNQYRYAGHSTNVNNQRQGTNSARQRQPTTSNHTGPSGPQRNHRR